MLLFNRKAYTFSQFILLWILGILFVILVCLNVLRYRATVQAKEAEAFMQEVRAEQEDRCALGRKYAVYNNHLKTFYKRKQSTRSIRYDVSSGHGITAHHKFFDYRLQMPSYADGRICCDNCENLNYYYSSCDVLTKRKDFIPAEPECTTYLPGKKGKGAASKTQEPPAVEKSMTADPELSATSNTQPEEPAVPQDPPQQTATAVQETAALSTQTPPQSATEQTDKPQKAKPAARVCKTPARGDFFVDGCDVYQAGARGTVVHTWNFDTCSYEVIQSCAVPARWKRTNTTKEEKGLYPSDLDDYCPQLLKSAPCSAGAGAGVECGTVDSVCYKDCKITQQTEVKESALIILYDVQVSVEKLQCMPAREIQVTVP